MQIIIPCAGKSTRYPTKLPKYLLPMPDGRYMFEKVVEPYIGYYPIRFIINKVHQDLFNVKNIILNKIKYNVTVVSLDYFTTGPAESVYLGTLDIQDGPIFIQDCDTIFKFSNLLKKENIVCYTDLDKNIPNIHNKSYIKNTDNKILIDIVEKQIISNKICVGGYGFENINQYRNFFKLLHNSTEEKFISHCIKLMLKENFQFHTIKINSYIDLGTYKDYIKYMGYIDD